MNKFIEVLEVLTNKKVIKPKMAVSYKDGEDPERLISLAEWLKRTIWQDVIHLKSTKKLDYRTTNDLDENNKLYPDYLKRRKKKNKAREEEGSTFSYSKHDWR